MRKIDAKALKEELLSGNFTTTYYDRLIADVVPTIEEGILGKIRAEINSPNRGTCDYFIADRIEEIINEYKEGAEE